MHTLPKLEQFWLFHVLISAFSFLCSAGSDDSWLAVVVVVVVYIRPDQTIHAVMMEYIIRNLCFFNVKFSINS